MWPNGCEFAFTVLDDTDNDTIHNVRPVYDLLAECDMRTSKSVWVYPPRDGFRGLGLVDDQYRQFIGTLASRGFEICLHNVGSGRFNREEIRAGLDLFKEYIGSDPKVHANHASNPDNLYWISKRFAMPLSFLYGMAVRMRGGNPSSLGDEPTSVHFWGDIAKESIRYVRNFTFNSINTLRADSMMPYTEKTKPYVNYWFSSSDGHTVKEFTDLIRPSNVDRLQREGGLCIVYTHFASGFVDSDGKVNERFADRITQLSQRPGWFAPVGEVLDYMVSNGQCHRDIGYRSQLRLNLLWIMDRIVKRLKYSR